MRCRMPLFGRDEMASGWMLLREKYLALLAVAGIPGAHPVLQGTQQRIIVLPWHTPHRSMFYTLQGDRGSGIYPVNVEPDGENVRIE